MVWPQCVCGANSPHVSTDAVHADRNAVTTGDTPSAPSAPCCADVPEGQSCQPAGANAWYRDDTEEDLEKPHLTDPPQYLTADEVFMKTGVRIVKVEDCDDEEKQENLRKQGGYNHFDWLEITPEILQDEYQKKLEQFYTEHLHTDEEVRLVTAGSGYFEIRDHDNKWIRLHVQKGHLLKLPSGMYHRFVLDTDKYIKMLRLFTSNPEWKSVTRPEGDSLPAREEYLRTTPDTAV